MDAKAWAIVFLATAALWLFAGFRWRVKAGLSALSVLAAIVIVAYPPILTKVGL